MNERTRDRMLTKRDRTWSASVRTPTQNRNSRHECRDLNTTLQYETRHADKRAHSWCTLKAARSLENTTLWECQGFVTKPWITLDQSDSTLTLPPPLKNYPNEEHQEHDKHDCTRLTHNNRQDKKNQNTEEKGEGGDPSQCQQGSLESHESPGRLRQFRSPAGDQGGAGGLSQGGSGSSRGLAGCQSGAGGLSQGGSGSSEGPAVDQGRAGRTDQAGSSGSGVLAGGQSGACRARSLSLGGAGRARSLLTFMPIARSLKTCVICGIVLCDKTAHFRVAFYCG